MVYRVFFSSLSGKTIRGLAFFGLSLVSVKAQRSYPLVMEPIVRCDSTSDPSAPASQLHDAAETTLPKRRRRASEGEPEPRQNGGAAQRYVETPSKDDPSVAGTYWRFDTRAVSRA